MISWEQHQAAKSWEAPTDVEQNSAPPASLSAHFAKAAIIGHEWYLNESTVKSLKSCFLCSRDGSIQRPEGYFLSQVTSCQQLEKSRKLSLGTSCRVLAKLQTRCYDTNFSTCDGSRLVGFAVMRGNRVCVAKRLWGGLRLVLHRRPIFHRLHSNHLFVLRRRAPWGSLKLGCAAMRCVFWSCGDGQIGSRGGSKVLNEQVGLFLSRGETDGKPYERKLVINSC